MAASDAKPVPLKNTAFRVSFDIENVTNGALITTWAGQDSEVSLDGGAFADCTNEATEIGTTGIGYLDLTAAEMNADTVIVKVTVTNTNARVVRLYFNPVESTDIPVNATAFSGDTVAADNAESFFDGTGYAGTGNTIPTVTSVTNLTPGGIADAVLEESVVAHSGVANSLAYFISQTGTLVGQINNTINNTVSPTISTISTALGSWTGTIKQAFQAIASKTASASVDIGGTHDPATDSTEAIRDRGDAAWTTGTSATAADVWAYGTRTLTAVDATVNIVNPFDANTARITIGYGEDRSTGSTNGALALTTTTDINLSTAGGTIYFAVREKQRRATEEAVFTRTGSATAALAYTVSLTSATTRLLLPGTYLWTAWHVASGVYTDLGHGDYVVADLVTPTV